MRVREPSATLSLLRPLPRLPSRSSAPRWLLVASFAVVAVVWGSTYLAIRVALESYPPFFLGSVRFIAAGLVLIAVARLRGERMPTAREWAAGALTGLLFFVVGNGLVNVAERSVSSGLASVLVATMPLWMTVYGRLFGARVTGRELSGVLLGLAGVVVMNFGGELRASPGGVACALLAPMGWALGSVASRRLPLPTGILRTGVQMLTGGLAMQVVSTAMHEHLGPASARAVGAMAYLTVFGSLLGFTAFSYLLEHTRPAVATSYAYVNPVIAVLLGVMLGGETLGRASAAGAAVVLAAVVLVQKRGSPALPRDEPAAAGVSSPHVRVRGAGPPGRQENLREGGA